MKEKIFKALIRFEETVRIDENKGGGHPEDYYYKEQEYENAKQDLIDLINKGVK